MRKYCLIVFLIFSININSLAKSIEFVIYFQKNEIALTEEGFQKLIEIETPIFESDYIKEKLTKGNLLIQFGAYQNKDDYDKGSCLSLKRYRFLVNYLTDKYEYLEDSHFLFSYDWILDDTMEKTGINVSLQSKFKEANIKLPHRIIKMDDDFYENLSEVGQEIRCNEEFYMQYRLLIVPYISKEFHEYNHCIGIEIHKNVIEFFQIKYKFEYRFFEKFIDVSDSIEVLEGDSYVLLKLVK